MVPKANFMKKNPLIVALDVPTKEKALFLVKELKDYVSIFKVGPVLFTRGGPNIIKDIKDLGADVFLDFKLYDIPNTVASTVSAIASLGVVMFTVHISGGKEMLKAAIDALKPFKPLRPKILGVTILTSVANISMEEILRLAGLAKEVGLEGIIASPQEIEPIRKTVGNDFLIVTPGIRPKGKPKGDQKRTATPKEAIQRGADYIVVGRPIIESNHPKEIVKRILDEIDHLI